MALTNNEDPPWTVDLEYRDPANDHMKFWQGRVSGSALYRKYGRIGTSGALNVKYFQNPASANGELDRLEKEKLARGYKPVKVVTYTATLKDPVYLNNFVLPVPVATKELPAYKATELDKMPFGHFNDLYERVVKERSRRASGKPFYPTYPAWTPSPAYLEGLKKAKDAKTHANITRFQNFLLGCAHAMACRAALRWTAGHAPYGKQPMSGLPWNAYDGYKVSKAVSEDNRFYTTTPEAEKLKKWGGTRLYSNPMSWTTQGDITHWLKESRYRYKANPTSQDTSPEYLH